MFYLIPFLLGLSIGSFINVCIYRIPKGESISFPSSYCPRCSYSLKVRDLVPVLSFFLLKGRCRQCKTKISWRYPFIEVLTGVLYSLFFLKYGFTLQALFYCFFGAGLMVVTFIDLDHLIIPNKVNLVLFILGIIFHVWVNPGDRVNPLFTFLGIGLFFLILQILFPGALGGGDVKLAAVLGLWLGWPQTAMAIFLGSFLGSLIGIYLVILNKKKRKEPLPYGPFLTVGTLVVLFLGDFIWSLLIKLFL